MRNSINIIIIGLIILIMPCLSCAFQNEPDGFRGMKWGADLKEFPGMSYKTGSGEDGLYMNKNDKLSIGDATLTSIYYGFYKKKLYSVWIVYKDYSNFQKLKETFSQQYGEGYIHNRFMESYSWNGSDININLKYSEISQEGAIMFVFEPISQSKRQDQSERAGKAASDL